MRHDGFWGGVGRWLLPFFLLCVISACGGNSAPLDEIDVGAQPEIPGPEPEVDITYDYDAGPIAYDAGPMGEEPIVQSTPPINHPEEGIAIVGSGAPSDFNPDDYSAVLDVTKELELHQKGDLRVWIGREDYAPEDEADMIRKEINFPADEGNYARITPYAPDFVIDPEESQIMRIVPSGSSVLFTIIPQKKGTFKISAKIELFDNPYFEGVPSPKTSNIVSVVVTVDPWVNFVAGLKKMGKVVWDTFLKFWGAIVALIFGALLFMARKFVRKKTGFMGDGIESSSLSGGGDIAPSESAEISETSEEPESEGGEGEDGVDYFDVGEGEDKQ